MRNQRLRPLPEQVYRQFIERVRRSNEATQINESGAQTEITFEQQWRAQHWYFEAREEGLDVFTAKAVLTVYEPG
jgi:uncharacterized protein (DUF849 family)